MTRHGWLVVGARSSWSRGDNDRSGGHLRLRLRKWCLRNIPVGAVHGLDMLFEVQNGLLRLLGRSNVLFQEGWSEEVLLVRAHGI
jgi:hypothetical protein